MNGIAEWRPVNSRGSDITEYRLEAEAGGMIQLESSIMKPFPPGNITINLNDKDLTSGVQYIVRVYAENMLGSSNSSNEEKFIPIGVTSSENGMMQ